MDVLRERVSTPLFLMQLGCLINTIDDELNVFSLEFFNVSLELINKRVKQISENYKEILDSPFDYTKDEYIEIDGKKSNYAADDNGLKENWRKFLKAGVL